MAAAAAIAGLAYAFAAAGMRWPAPLADAQGSPWWSLILMGAIWPLILAFIVTGIASAVRLSSSLKPDASGEVAALAPGAPDAAAWLRAARLGTAGWWALTSALSGAVILSALKRG